LEIHRKKTGELRNSRNPDKEVYYEKKNALDSVSNNLQILTQMYEINAMGPMINEDMIGGLTNQVKKTGDL